MFLVIDLNKIFDLKTFISSLRILKIKNMNYNI